jgi:hypothetical protein
MIVKPLGNEVLLTGNNALSVGNASLVRVTNIDASPAAVVFRYANGVQYADASLGVGESIIVQKRPTDLLIATNMKAGAVAYKG